MAPLPSPSPSPAPAPAEDSSPSSTPLSPSSPIVITLPAQTQTVVIGSDALAILLNPLLHTRRSIKAALAVFKKKANAPMARLFKPHPMLFLELAVLFDIRGDEGMVARVLTTAALCCHRNNNRTNMHFVETRKNFFMSLFHKSDALRRAVFMYIATASSSSKRALDDKDSVLSNMAALVTAEDIEFVREHGGGGVKRLCSTIVA